jgi:hypothetical protein
VIWRGTALEVTVHVKKIVVSKYLASVAFAVGVLCSSPVAAASSSTKTADDSRSAVAVQQVRATPVGGLRDEIAMVIVGTALIGLAAAVRRAA